MPRIKSRHRGLGRSKRALHARQQIAHEASSTANCRSAKSLTSTARSKRVVRRPKESRPASPAAERQGREWPGPEPTAACAPVSSRKASSSPREIEQMETARAHRSRRPPSPRPQARRSRAPPAGLRRVTRGRRETGLRLRRPDRRQMALAAAFRTGQRQDGRGPVGPAFNRLKRRHV